MCEVAIFVRKVYIVGVGYTKIGRLYHRSLKDLFAEAAWKAIEDAGNNMPQALVVGNETSSSLQDQDNLGAYLADYAGLGRIPAFKVEAACGSGGAAFYTAYALVASGLADIVMAAGVEKLSDARSSGTTAALAKAAEAEYEAFYGASFTSINALIMHYYMHKYSIDYEDLAEWPVVMHEYASQNPYAHLRFKVTREKVLSSRIIAYPLRLLDASPISDGAAAIILASENVARKITDTPIRVAGVGMATDNIYVAARKNIDTLVATIKAGEQAFKMANIKPKDLDVLELHDAFSILGLISLEDLGFAEKGKAAKLFNEGAFHLGDKPTVNPSGGLKARGHPVGATGIYQIMEIAMQLRGDFPGVRVDNAEKGLAQSIGGAGTTITITILSR